MKMSSLKIDICDISSNYRLFFKLFLKSGCLKQLFYFAKLLKILKDGHFKAVTKKTYATDKPKLLKVY
jgi:hypothetical protein